MQLYRAEIMAYSDGTVSCSMFSYRIVKETRCGVWIELWHNKRKFVNLQAERKWAWPTEADAMISLARRKARQLSILKAQLRDTERCLEALADGIQPGEHVNDGTILRQL